MTKKTKKKKNMKMIELLIYLFKKISKIKFCYDKKN